MSKDPKTSRTEFIYHSLNISASRLAALVGLNPYAHLPELLVDLVYQGHSLILENEAQLLDLELTTPDQAMETLASKAGILSAVQQLPHERPNTTTEAAQLKEGILAQATNLNETDLKRLKEHIRSKVDTNYGSRHEDAALDRLELTLGCPVTQRNQQIRQWDFTLENNRAHPTPTEKSSEPFFSIRGSIDGMYEEVVMLRSDDDELPDALVRPVIVECKHRLRKIAATPPLYEQVQAIVYCLLYDTTEADIVQVFRDTDIMELRRYRVSVDDPILQHRQHWEATILPRLVQLVQVVYQLRRDDGLRYQLLQAVAQEQKEWPFFYKLCPWLKDCENYLINC